EIQAAAGANDGLLRRLIRILERRTEIVEVPQVRLDLISQTRADIRLGIELITALNERGIFQLAHVHGGIAGTLLEHERPFRDVVREARVFKRNLELRPLY